MPAAHIAQLKPAIIRLFARQPQSPLPRLTGDGLGTAVARRVAALQSDRLSTTCNSLARECMLYTDRLSRRLADGRNMDYDETTKLNGNLR